MAQLFQAWMRVVALAALVGSAPNPGLAHSPAGALSYQFYVNPVTSGSDSASSITNESGIVYQAADDFFIPNTDDAWEIHRVDVMAKVNVNYLPPVTYTVRFYSDEAHLPGTLLAAEVVSASAITIVTEPISGLSADEYQIPINPITFAPGITVWVSVQAHLTSTLGNWFWHIGSPQTGAPAAYINSTAVGCETWQTGVECGFGYDVSPDHRFSLAYLPVPLADHACRVNWRGRVWLGASAATLQSAVDALPNQVLQVSGTCAGAQMLAGGRQAVVITQPVTLEGGYDLRWQNRTATTVIDAQGAGRGARVLAPATLSQLVVQNGVATDSVPGGGIFSLAPLTLTEVVVFSNTSNVGGGGLAFITGTVLGGRVAHNTANFEGGGVRVAGTAHLSGTVIEDNFARLDAGGGVWVDDGAVVTLTQVTLRHNRTTIYGGGAYALGALTLHGGLVEANQAGNFTLWRPHAPAGGTPGQGGGVAVFGGALQATDVTFRANAGVYGGGGAYVFNATAHLMNTRFFSNTAGQEGGGLRLESGMAWLTNTVLARNQAPHGAAALTLGANPALWLAHVTLANPAPTSLTALEVAGSTAITNSIFHHFAVGAQVMAGTLTEDYNLFSSVTTPLTGTGIITGANRVVGAPNFAVPSADDYAILAGSAAIDAGLPLGVLTDLTGAARTLPPDLGAYEFQPLVALFQLFLPLVIR